MEKRSEEIQLYRKKNGSDLIPLIINKQSYQICFVALAKCSDFILKNFAKDTKNTFSKAIKNAQTTLNISSDNIKFFMNALSGDSIKINQINSFDLYKLSSFFEINPILEKVYSLWQFQPNSFENDLCQFLQSFDNSVKNDKQRNYLNEFIQHTKILNKMKSKIDQFISCRYSPYFIYFLLTNCDPKTIPQDELFNYLLNSEDDHQIFIQFLNFEYLFNERKNHFFLFIFGRYSQLLRSNEEYLNYTKLNKDDESSTQLLMQSSKHGNCVASNQLSNLLKEETEKYNTICDAQKKSADLLKNFYQKVSPESRISGRSVSNGAANTNRGGNKNRGSSGNKNDNDDAHDSNNGKAISRSKSDSNSKNRNAANINRGSSNKKRGNSSSNNGNDDDDDDDANDDTNIGKTIPNSKSDSNDASKQIGRHSTYDDYVDDDEIFDNSEEECTPEFAFLDEKGFDHDATQQGEAKKGSKKKRESPFTEVELRNQEVFKETSLIVESGHYTDVHEQTHDISKMIRQSNKNTKTIDKNYSFSSFFSSKFKDVVKWGPREKKQIYKKITVVNEGTFEAARKLKEEDKIENVCALNFASATKPGGGVINGRTAQEETLSRQSSLYFSLIKDDTMYKYFKKFRNPFYKHFMIYSPNVVVFRNENYDLVPPICVSVITSPAVNYALLTKKYKHGERDHDVYTCMKNRCRKILELAIYQNNKGIVLGAFGCGVFRNKPEDISKIFKELIVDEFYGLFFDKIVFAVKSNPKKKDVNFDVFKETFKIY